MGCCCSKCWASITLVFAHLAYVVNYVSLAAQRDTCRPDVVHYCHTLSGRTSHHCLARLPPSPQKQKRTKNVAASVMDLSSLENTVWWTQFTEWNNQNGMIARFKGIFTVIKCALNLSIRRCADAIMMPVHHSALRFITAAGRPLLHLGLLHHWDEILDPLVPPYVQNLKRQ